MKQWMERERTGRMQDITEGFGTVDVLMGMRKYVEECEERYVAGLFLNISGVRDCMVAEGAESFQGMDLKS